MTKQEALDEISLGCEYYNTTYFDRFLRKVDRSGQSELEVLFGGEEAYIDTAGDYDTRGYGANGSIIEYEEENGYDVYALFIWYRENFEKAWRWMYPLRKIVLTNKSDGGESGPGADDGGYSGKRLNPPIKRQQPTPKTVLRKETKEEKL